MAKLSPTNIESNVVLLSDSVRCRTKALVDELRISTSITVGVSPSSGSLNCADNTGVDVNTRPPFAGTKFVGANGALLVVKLIFPGELVAASDQIKSESCTV